MLLLLLPGCVIIQKPEDGKTLSTPSLEAAVFLPFTYKDKSFVAYLDEKDVTSQFIVKAKDRFATATLIKPAPGEHLLKVSACWEWLVLFVIPMSSCANDKSIFTIESPEAATINVSVTAPGCRPKEEPPVNITIYAPIGSNSSRKEYVSFNDNCTANYIFTNIPVGTAKIEIKPAGIASYPLTCERYLNAEQTLNIRANTVQKTISCQ